MQRDRYAHFQLTLALIAASLEKFATEIRSLQRTEVHEVEEPFGQGQTGSSAMPHKRNPELAERICGLARLIRGHSVTALENVALWGERDISHSSAERIILPDSCLALDYILSVFNRIIRGLRVFPGRHVGQCGEQPGRDFQPEAAAGLGGPRSCSRSRLQDRPKETRQLAGTTAETSVSWSNRTARRWRICRCNKWMQYSTMLITLVTSMTLFNGLGSWLQRSPHDELRLHRCRSGIRL